MMLGEVGTIELFAVIIRFQIETIELFAAMILFQVETIELFDAIIRFQIEMMLSETGTVALLERSITLFAGSVAFSTGIMKVCERPLKPAVEKR